MKQIKSVSLSTSVLVTAIILFISNPSYSIMTPGQYLAAQPKPLFKTGHRLPWLGLGWPAPVAHNLTNISDLSNWIPFGYAMHLGPYLTAEYVNQQAAVSTSVFSRAVALHKASATRYPISVCISKEFFVTPETEMDSSTYLRDVNGNFILSNGQKQWSPEGHEGWSQMGHARAEGLRALKNLGVQTCDIIENTEEYPYPGICQDAALLARDPRVTAAQAAMGAGMDYLGYAGARLEKIITDSVCSVFPSDKQQIYTPYSTMNFCRDRGARYALDHGGWGNNWTMYCRTGDLPGIEYYYKFGWGTYGFQYIDFRSFNWDMPRLIINEVAQEIAGGYKNSYPWLATSMSDRVGYLPITSYMGYAKFLYTAGMIGGVVQDYSGNAGGMGSSTALQFDETNPPHYIVSFIAHGHVHALFSNLDDFLLDGDLLPGPGVCDFSYDLPGYRFPVNEDINIWVLARKKRAADEWIVTAWLATDTLSEVAAGLNSRIVVSKKGNVTIPGIGAMTVNARNCGTVYMVKKINNVMSMKLLDPDPNDPSNIPGDETYVPVAVENFAAPTWDNVTPTVSMALSGGYGSNTVISPGDIFENAGQGYGAGTTFPDLWFAWPSGSYSVKGFPYATNGVAMAELSLNQKTNVPITVSYQVTGTATQGTDYDSLSGKVTFAAGDDFEYIVVKPVHDFNTSEGDETIRIQLQSGLHYILGTTTTVTGRIIDNKNPVGVLPFTKGESHARPNVFVHRTSNLLQVTTMPDIHMVELLRPDGRLLYSVPISNGKGSIAVLNHRPGCGTVVIRARGINQQAVVVQTLLY